MPPLYTYRCERGHEFELKQGIKDEPIKVCLDEDECCEAEVKRVPSSTSFQLKGNGWYVTDYKKGKSE